MTKVIQITDTHIVREGDLAYGKVDTAAALAETVTSINRILPQIGPVDLAIVTGDLTDFGSAEEYHRFRSLMEPLQIPYRAVPGNHDDREAMRAAFADQEWMPSSGPIDWVADLGNFVLVGLDSNVTRAQHGHLTKESLDFLKRQMSRLSPKPFLVGIHHPPFPTGILAMDEQNLHDSAHLREVLDMHAG
jgi:3',5'-cyclic AMP phosphodiesterase CpdA